MAIMLPVSHLLIDIDSIPCWFPPIIERLTYYLIYLMNNSYHTYSYLSLLSFFNNTTFIFSSLVVFLCNILLKASLSFSSSVYQAYVYVYEQIVLIESSLQSHLCPPSLLHFLPQILFVFSSF